MIVDTNTLNAVIEKTFDPAENFTGDTHGRKDRKKFGMAYSVKGFSDIGVNNVNRFTIIERSKPMVDSTEKLRTRRATRQKSKLVRTKKIVTDEVV